MYIHVIDNHTIKYEFIEFDVTSVFSFICNLTKKPEESRRS